MSEEVRGKLAVIKFEGKKCIHSRQCVLSRPDVFVPNVDGEWIHPDAATPDEIVALALACPSGAIGYERLDGGANESAPLVNVARVRENGPVAIHADLTIKGQAKTFRATLCRCGASKNKPFCDGSHTAAGFSATGETPTKESTTLAVRGGELTITPLPDGPLLVEGSLEIVSGTGRTTDRVQKTALCRCGQSSSKPYCDGTHRTVGFKGLFADTGGISPFACSP
jgi:CDGSH-type Zn-finger protein/ferredoxin